MAKEAAITINGHVLSYGQSLTLRVAISSFAAEMSRPQALGEDSLGMEMTRLYAERAREIEAFIFGNQNA